MLKIMLPSSVLTMALLLLSVGIFEHQVLRVIAWTATPQDSRRVFLRDQVAKPLVTFLGGSSILAVVEPVSAYERRDVGDENRSATTAAYNEQAYQTNNRLEQQGFKLDTREEEQAKLKAAMTSISYDTSVPQRVSGYGTTASRRTETNDTNKNR
jgi:hypothetical protein